MMQISNAATIQVASINALQTAMNNSNASDVINLANGHYTNNTITISKNNITVQAATPGGVFLDGTNTIVISGNNTTFSGFQFTSGTITGNVISVTGSNNTITQLNFKDYSAQKYIVLNAPSQYNEVSYSNFENKPIGATAGNLIHIDPSATVPGYHKIRYCSFQNMPGLGGDNGNECIRISNGATSTYISRTTVEFCYFNNTGMGDSEAISNKCRENIIRYNTCVNNQNAMFCFRNGDNCVAYGNFFIGAGGIRVKEANNIYCYNNYFENAGIGGIADAVTYIYYTANSTNVLNNINFLHNTFVDCGLIDLGGVGATNGTWANNIFKKTGTIFNNPNNGTSFKGNIYKGTLGISIPTGMTNSDPLLTLNADGYFGLSASSPCIDASDGSYPTILNIPGIDTLLMDIQGKTRPASRTQKDVGCEEYNAAGTTINRPLKLSDVGPSYLKTVTSTMLPSVDPFEFSICPNPESHTIAVTYSLSCESTVHVALFNLNGILVSTFITNQKRSSGIYTEHFNIADLTSGVFFVRLATNNQSRTVKFLNL